MLALKYFSCNTQGYRRV